MPFDEDRWRQELQHQRREKDRFFKRHQQSPIPPEQRDAFEGLAYYDPDPAYRCVVSLTRDRDPEHLTIPRTGGDEVTYVRVGALELDLPAGRVRLAAYETPGSREDELFTLFRDATSGKETYGAGRYLEVPRAGPGDDAGDDGAGGSGGGERWVVDLNLAYHPFCAYDDAYTCPLPPHENWLDVPIRAGERLPEA